MSIIFIVLHHSYHILDIGLILSLSSFSALSSKWFELFVLDWFRKLVVLYRFFSTAFECLLFLSFFYQFLYCYNWKKQKGGKWNGFEAFAAVLSVSTFMSNLSRRPQIVLSLSLQILPRNLAPILWIFVSSSLIWVSTLLMLGMWRFPG